MVTTVCIAQHQVWQDQQAIGVLQAELALSCPKQSEIGTSTGSHLLRLPKAKCRARFCLKLLKAMYQALFGTEPRGEASCSLPLAPVKNVGQREWKGKNSDVWEAEKHMDKYQEPDLADQEGCIPSRRWENEEAEAVTQHMKELLERNTKKKSKLRKKPKPYVEEPD
ncbi:hypothetical protein HPG69_000835, partial [Diceros bicornis minor]